MRFVLCRRLSSGPSSVVHRARDLREERDVVLKRCRDPAQGRHELSTVRQLAAGGCRNIVRLAEDRLVGDEEVWFTEPPHEFYRQPYDHPAALATVPCDALPASFKTDADARGLLFDVLTALADVHALGHIHADVKRANVLRDGARYRLIDFGISLPVAAADDLDSATIRGTPFYMAPELVQGLPVTTMVDMYSLGVTIYDMLHGGAHPLEMMDGVSGDLGFQALLAASSYDARRWLNRDAPLAGDLCALLLPKYSQARLSAREALGHPLFTGKAPGPAAGPP